MRPMVDLPKVNLTTTIRSHIIQETSVEECVEIYEHRYAF